MLNFIIADVLLVGGVAVFDGLEFTVFGIGVLLLLVGIDDFLEVRLLQMVIAVIDVLRFLGFAGVSSSSHRSIDDKMGS